MKQQVFTNFMAALFDELSPQSRTPWPMQSSRGRTCHRRTERHGSQVKSKRIAITIHTIRSPAPLQPDRPHTPGAHHACVSHLVGQRWVCSRMRHPWLPPSC